MLTRSSISISIIALLLASCSPIFSGIYTVFDPENGTKFHVTFEYPSSWTWEHPSPSDRKVSSDWIKLYDPEWKPQAGQTSNCYKGGKIHIAVYDGNPGEVLESQVQALKFGIDVAHSLEVISDKEIQIDGRTSRSMVLKQKPYEDTFCQYEAEITRAVFLPIDNELYVFYFSARENEQNTKFADAFAHILNTVKVKP